MSAPNGYNPMRWNCDKRGCYNIKQRPKIQEFAECLPGVIAFTDIDGTVEVNGRFLFLEFKSGGPREIPKGQRIYYERLTRTSERIVVAIVYADAETMEISGICVIRYGIIGTFETCSIDSLKERIHKWSYHAFRLPSVMQTRISAHG